MTKQITEHAAAAKMIRKELKKHGIKGTVRARTASMMTAVDVTITDDVLPATVEAITRFVSQFEYGHFDGMTDMYEYSNRRDDLPQVKYASVSVDYSDEIKNEILEGLRAQYADFADLREGDYSDVCNDRAGNEWVSTWVHRTLSGVEFPEFWTNRKPRVAA